MADMRDYLRKSDFKASYRQVVITEIRRRLAENYTADQVREIMDSVEVRKCKEVPYKVEVVVLTTLHKNLRLAVAEAIPNLLSVRVMISHPKKPARRAVDTPSPDSTTPPKFGERILLLILRTKEERANIPGDLEEEYRKIAAKHGARYAKIWYYKQVSASAWPSIWKTIRWGLLASVGEWIRRVI